MSPKPCNEIKFLLWFLSYQKAFLSIFLSLFDSREGGMVELGKYSLTISTLECKQNNGMYQP
jgi:hypothetical protein